MYAENLCEFYWETDGIGLVLRAMRVAVVLLMIIEVFLFELY